MGSFGGFARSAASVGLLVTAFLGLKGIIKSIITEVAVLSDAFKRSGAEGVKAALATKTTFQASKEKTNKTFGALKGNFARTVATVQQSDGSFKQAYSNVWNDNKKTIKSQLLNGKSFSAPVIIKAENLSELGQKAQELSNQVTIPGIGDKSQIFNSINSDLNTQIGKTCSSLENLDKGTRTVTISQDGLKKTFETTGTRFDEVGNKMVQIKAVTEQQFDEIGRKIGETTTYFEEGVNGELQALSSVATEFDESGKAIKITANEFDESGEVVKRLSAVQNENIISEQREIISNGAVVSSQTAEAKASSEAAAADAMEAKQSAINAGTNVTTSGTMDIKSILSGLGKSAAATTKAFLPLIGVLATAAAVFGAFALYDYNTEEAKKARQAKQDAETSEAMGEEANRQSEKLASLEGDLKSWTDIQDTLAKVNVGTLEWQESIAEANQKHQSQHRLGAY